MKFIGTVTKVDLQEGHKAKLTIEAILSPDIIRELADMVGVESLAVEVVSRQARLPEVK